MKFFFFLTLLLSLNSCTEYTGGSVEIAWVIRGTDHRVYACDASILGDKYIHSIRLKIIGENEPYKDVDICENGLVENCIFRCKASSGGSTQRGVTTFSIPSGVWFVGMVPLDSNGEEIPPHVIQVPQVVKTTIAPGELTFMGVWQLVIDLNIQK
ncbi:MAG: hypothetical protein JXR95_10910 [Deltaproteobacteria bacterium]|nr:hypothetical protein [Deltaproteobacteria bacterium]